VCKPGLGKQKIEDWNRYLSATEVEQLRVGGNTYGDEKYAEELQEVL